MSDEPIKNDWASEVEVRKRDGETYQKILKHIDNGVYLEHVRKDGEIGNDTLLMMCAEQGLTSSVRLLVSLIGVDVHMKNSQGKTAFDMAVNDDIKKMLREAEQGVFIPVLRGGPQQRG